MDFFYYLCSQIVKSMKRAGKITLIVLGVVFALGIAFFVGADVLLSRYVQGKVDKALAGVEGCEAKCGSIKVFLFSGTAEVDSIRFVYHDQPINKRDSVGPGMEVLVEKVVVGRLFYSMLLNKNVLISDVRVVRPSVEVWLDDKHPDKCLPKSTKNKEESRKTKEESANKKVDIHQYITDAEVQRFHLKNAQVRLHSLRTKLDVVVDSCSLTAHGLRFDSVFHYSDSTYDFSLGYANVLLPDGRVRIETHNIAQENGGELNIGATRVRHTMNKRKLGDLVKEPVSWIDMQVESVTTSEFNPIRKAMAKDYTLESIKVVIGKMDVFRDNRHKPTHTYPMPQTAILQSKVPFHIAFVNAQIKQLDVALATTDVNCGEMHLQKINAAVQNITNKKGATMNIDGHCPFGSGIAQAQIGLTMNNACDFTTHLNLKGAQGQFLNPFLRPLVGISFEMEIDELETRYSGNSVKADGKFKLLYHGLNVKVHKEDDIPFKVVTQHANTFTNLANSLIPKSNPTVVDYEPREYYVEWKHDEWKPFPLYLFGPCIDGVKKTLLPGLNVHYQTNMSKRK